MRLRCAAFGCLVALVELTVGTTSDEGDGRVVRDPWECFVQVCSATAVSARRGLRLGLCCACSRLRTVTTTNRLAGLLLGATKTDGLARGGIKVEFTVFEKDLGVLS